MFMHVLETIKILEQHNRWRLGFETTPTDPKKLTEAIESALKLLKQVN